jgi:hypothetical protein
MTMRKPVLALLALSLCLLAWAGVAAADDQQMFKPVPVMKLPPKSPVLPKQAISAADTSSRIFDSWKAAEAVVRAAHTELLARSNQCQAAEFTRAEQAAAGCQATDTVRKCNGKLYGHCVGPAMDRWHQAHMVFSTASISLSKAVIQYQDRFQFMSPSY